MEAAGHRFIVDRWRVFKRTALFTLPILVWPIALNLDGFLDPSRLRENLITFSILVAVILCVPFLRVLYVWRRRIEIGPDWIWGPTEELFEHRKIPKDEIARLEYQEDGKRILVRSSKSCAIVVSPGDYPPESRSLLLDLISRFDPEAKDRAPVQMEAKLQEPHESGAQSMAEKKPKHKPQLRFGGIWPVINKEPDARWAVEQGMWTAIIITVFISISGIWTYLSPSPEHAESGLRIWSLVGSVIDAAMYLAIAVGLYFNSRIAAVAGLAIYLGTRIVLWQPEHLGQIVLIAIFTLGFVSGIRGTFAFHRFEASEIDSFVAPLEP